MADPGLLAKQLLQKNFPKFGTIRKLCIYQEMADSEYDANNREVLAIVVSTHNLYMIFDIATQSNLANVGISFDDPVVKDLKVAIFPSQDLPIIPKINDVIVQEDSSKWLVIGIPQDPIPAHFSLVVKRNG